ncbi:MAG: type I restriction endonuclease subunit R [Deltaproteobacteria bacterium]|nr:type I restriction endonuclease subunit R [Deltaproteobacteria bacterium]
MHETSLEGTILDYLTGQEIRNSTFEDLRQALARLMTEECGFPKESLKPRTQIRVIVDGQTAEQTIDIAAFKPDGKPLMAVLFCFGKPGTFLRQSVAAARLGPDGPFPLTLVTDTKEFFLTRTADEKEILEGSSEFPSWRTVLAMAAEAPAWPADEIRKQREARILLAYASLSGPCCGDSCSLDEDRP